MSTKPNFALKRLRESTGLTQRQFAARLGMPWRTLVAIEVGQRELTAEKLDKLMVEFGVLPESLRNRNGQPLALNGKPYSEQYFFEHEQRKIAAKLEGIFGEMAEKAAVQLQALFSVAAERGRLLPALKLFDDFTAKATRLLKLETAWKAELKKGMPLDPEPLFELHKGKRLLIYGRKKATQVAAR